VSKLKLPQWECQTASEAKAMVAWVNAELDQLETIRQRFLDCEEEGGGDAGYQEYRAAKQLADDGKIEQLQEMYPHFAEFLQLPKLKRGEHRKDRVIGPVMKAAIDVKFIRKRLWKKYYGKSNRPQGDLVTAEQIAADRHRVTVAAIKNKMKKKL
jgi:hypothetical protein